MVVIAVVVVVVAVVVVVVVVAAAAAAAAAVAAVAVAGIVVVAAVVAAAAAVVDYGLRLDLNLNRFSFLYEKRGVHARLLGRRLGNDKSGERYGVTRRGTRLVT